jgi:phosphate transport system protein
MDGQGTRPAARSSLDRSLLDLKDDVLRLGGLVDTAITRAMRALRNQDHVLAEEVIAHDDEINDLRFEIDKACLGLIATQQPAAGDLRAIVAVMNMLSDLERMGDHAAGISKVVLRMENSRSIELPRGIDRMVDLTRDMLRRSLDAYAQRDSDTAYAVASQDDYIDSQYKLLFRELLDLMVADKDRAEDALYLLFVGHNLERIADRVTNIAERIIFMSSGEMWELNPEPGVTDIN